MLRWGWPWLVGAVWVGVVWWGQNARATKALGVPRMLSFGLSGERAGRGVSERGVLSRERAGRGVSERGVLSRERAGRGVSERGEMSLSGRRQVFRMDSGAVSLSGRGQVFRMNSGRTRVLGEKKEREKRAQADPFLVLMGGGSSKDSVHGEDGGSKGLVQQDGKAEDRVQRDGGSKGLVQRLVVPERKGRTYGIFVGMGRFEEKERYHGLRYAASDACRVMKAFLRYGRMKKKDVRLLVQDRKECEGVSAEAPSERRFRYLLGDWLPRVLRREDRVVVFFSSHGELLSGEGYYLIFSETRADRLSSTALDHRHLKRMLDRLSARQQFVFLDTCHSGGVSAKLLLIPQPLKVLESEGRFVFASSKATQRAIQYGAVKMSLFSYILEKALLGGADHNGDGIVDHQEVARYLWSWVPRIASQRFKHAQDPVVWGISNGLLPLTWVPKRTNP